MEVEALHVISRCHAEAKLGGQEALSYASRARELCIETGGKSLEGLSLHHMSLASAAMGETEAALQNADEALDIYLELKDKCLEASELLSMAHIHMQCGSLDRALSDAEDALELFQAVGSSKEVSASGIIFQVYTAKGDTRRALRT